MCRGGGNHLRTRSLYRKRNYRFRERRKANVLFQVFAIHGSPSDRYAAVDVPFQIQVQDALKNGMDRFIFGYDIACNFSINAHKRCAENPNSVLDPQFWDSLKPENNVVLFRVNKFHLHSHKPTCSDRFSLNYTKGVGMRSLEEVESNWSHMNHIQYEVREMDAGARIDTITTHMLSLNNSKINNMRECSITM
jgi:hypothetical protein